LVLAPVAAVPGLQERLGLKDADLLKDAEAKDELCVVLGLAVVTGHGHNGNPTYGPARHYLPDEVVKWTKRMSAPRRNADLRELRRQAARIELAEARRRAAEAEATREAERRAVEEAQRRNNPLARIAALEKRLKDFGIDT
jgi:hypothetical protein